MRTFNVGFLAVLGCIAMIGATPIGDHSLVEAIKARQLPPILSPTSPPGPPLAYVALQQLMEVLTD